MTGETPIVVRSEVTCGLYLVEKSTGEKWLGFARVKEVSV